MDKPLIIANKTFASRLFIGTGKFASSLILKKCIDISETNMVTVAVRRVDFENKEDDFVSVIDQKKQLFLPNTSGARTAEEAIRIAKIAKFSGISDWIKLEVTPEPNYLLPDPIETLKAAEELVKLGFTVLPYINADPILAKRLENVGCATVMPLASPIGSNQGLQTTELLKIIIEQANIPVVIDAGLGSPSHAAEAMELGADAVLVNTAIATAEDPVKMASAFKYAVQAGYKGYHAGLPTQQVVAHASSPLTGFLQQ
jgi:thiazole synthase